MITHKDNDIWLKIEILNLEYKFSTEKILRILADEVQDRYAKVKKSYEESSKTGCAGPSAGELGHYKELSDKLKEWRSE